MPDWLVPLLTVLGSVGGAYLSVKVGLARIEERHNALVERVHEQGGEIVRLRKRVHEMANRLSRGPHDS